MVLFDICSAFFLIGCVSAISPDILKEYKRVCEMSSVRKVRSSLENLLQKEEQFGDCDHSNGFHLNRDFCSFINLDTQFRQRSLTVYGSEGKMVIFLNIAFTKTSSNNRVSNWKWDSIGLFKDWQYFIVIWIKTRALSLDSPHIYKIHYFSKNDNKNTIKTKTKDLRESLRNEDQILLSDIPKQSGTREFNITIETDSENLSDYSIEDTYLIFCLVKEGERSDCKPIEVGERGISCECDSKNQLATILIVLGFWIVMIAIAGKPVLDLLSDKDKHEKTVFPMMVGCTNSRASNYQYHINVRFAKVSTDFDLRDVNVDLEFKTEKNETVGVPIRFKASLLEKHIVMQIKIIMCRLTKMPELKKVQCNHSGPNNASSRIYLLGVSVVCRKGEDEPKLYKFNRYIVRQSRVFAMTQEDDKDQIPFEDEEVQRRIFSKFELNLTFIEFIWVLFVNITVIGFTAAIIPGLLSKTKLAWITLLGMFIAVLVSSLVAVVFNWGFLAIYKCLRLQELKQQWKMNSRYENVFFGMIRVYYITSILVSVILGLTIGILKTYQNTITTYKWFCSVFCASALFVLVWKGSTQIVCFKRRKTEFEDDGSVSSSAVSSVLSFAQ